MWKSAPAGSSSLIQAAAGLHRGTGARRTVTAEDPHHLSTDPSPSRWIQKFALAIRRAEPSEATRTNRAMIQVQNCRDEQTTGKILSKNSESRLKLFMDCYSNPISVNCCDFKSMEKLLSSYDVFCITATFPKAVIFSKYTLCNGSVVESAVFLSAT